MRLAGKVAIVTGGGQGIGSEYCRRFAQEGAVVAIVDLRASEAAGVVKEICDAGGNAMAIAADVSDEASTEAMAREVNDRFGSIDVLVNNAALFHDLEFGNQTLEYLRKVLDVNVLGIIACGRAVFPYMKQQQRGSIINIASLAAYTMAVRPAAPKVEAASFGSYAYGLSKSAVVYLTKAMAMTAGPSGIRVNAIAPGIVMTDATKKVMNEAARQAYADLAALGRSLEPTDLTGTAVFLASDDSALMTGQTLLVDAGLYSNA